MPLPFRKAYFITLAFPKALLPLRRTSQAPVKHFSLCPFTQHLSTGICPSPPALRHLPFPLTLAFSLMPARQTQQAHARVSFRMLGLRKRPNALQLRSSLFTQHLSTDSGSGPRKETAKSALSEYLFALSIQLFKV